jgi:acetolactate synthase-1/2/3 large subunit
MSRSKMGTVDRRKFLRGAATASAAALVGAKAKAQSTSSQRPPGPPPMVASAETGTPPELDVLTVGRSGSDFMVDVLKTLGFDYATSNPGSSFRGLHESIINHGGNVSPEWLTCCHEESSVAMAHGYAKIDGTPLLVVAHGTVGLQHAAMAVYNAFCDRVPVFIVLGNTLDATQRRPGAEWVHSVQDAAAMVRDYVKWDDMPVSLGHFAESAVRAYKIAMTPPMAPVMLVADSELQERPISDDAALRIPKLTLPSPPTGDSGAVAEVARLLVAAENPVIVADRYARTPAGMSRLIELAETLQAAVIDQGDRMNFPSHHSLNQGGGAIGRADVVLALELSSIWGTLNRMRDQLYRSSRSRISSDTKVISITAGDLYTKSNYQDFNRFQEVDVAIAADAEATLPSLIEAVKRQLTDDRRRVLNERGEKFRVAKQAALQRRREEAVYGWNASPISTARLAAEIWEVIKREDWSLVNNSIGWTRDLWNFDKPYHHIGDSAGAGQGYGPPAAVGAALANRKHGRLSVNIGSDGDLMYVGPGAFWTAAHHKIPLLTVVHNNRAYHQEYMHIQRMAARHERGIDRFQVGSALTNPNIDYAKMAQSMGLYGEGPIENPNDLGPALRRALAVVKNGEPALIDVVTQPR